MSNDMMNDDQIRELLDEAAETPPASTFDSERALAAGHRAVLKRRLALGGGGVAVAAVLAGALLASGVLAPSGAGGGTANPATGGDGVRPAAEGPEVTLPELDPDMEYFWQAARGPLEQPETDATRAYTEAFTSYLAEAFPDYEDVSAATFNQGAGGDTEGAAKFLRGEYELVERTGYPEGTDTPTGFTMPMYSLAFSTESGGADHGTLRFTPGGQADSLYVTVYPRGGFTEGTGDGVLDLVRCSDWERDIQADGHSVYDVTCDEETLPNGDRVVHATNDVTTTYPDEQGDEVTDEWSYLTTVLYRTDGTAVLVDDYAHESGDGSAGSLTSADLLGIAAALPDVAIE